MDDQYNKTHAGNLPPPYPASQPEVGFYPQQPPAPQQYPQQQYGGNYGPPPPSAPAVPPGQVSPQAVNVTVAPAPIPPPVIVTQFWGRRPQMAQCPGCRAQVTTSVEYEVSGATWLICVLLWFVGLGLGCCLIPFCVDDCQKATHRCPNCNLVMGFKDVF
ncbi:lipopolysaccharide-induced tumor necrosis factor-alpha factor homolog [Convolutriloba macropyga]|uniref:lipopolysaccharide-induced tumor necrosis factor-alpha factor homolog n=1 Tax=Convolutriloba macropyga TaxID=536237 RepID=UPI003F5276B8